MNRRPVAGDTILYVLCVQKDGKYKAENARIKGVAKKKSIKADIRKKDKRSILRPVLLGLILFFVIVVLVNKIFTGQGELLNRTSTFVDKVTRSAGPGKSSNKSQAGQETISQKYRCEGKVHCSEMSSCEEALFYQRNCLGTKMDGDHDGKPCEDWCGH
ncbi:MAG: hypothetical protein D3910_27950 [Candidatus Electrothrix sp. ATG2]|nr:hypothetical protein [Candidatus Electrothrix sp. ATG2]